MIDRIPNIRLYLPSLYDKDSRYDYSGLRDFDIQRIRKALLISKKYGLGISVALWHRDLELIVSNNLDLSAASWMFLFCGGVTYEQIQIMQTLNASISHLPRQRSNYTPFSEMIEAGLRCSVMSDDFANGGDGDMFQSIRKVQMIEQIRFDDLFYLPCGKQLELITIDAAKCLDIDDKKGSIEVGKDADIIVIEMETPHTVPWKDMPVHRLMIDNNSRRIKEVFVNGEHLVQDGKITFSAPNENDLTKLNEILAKLPKTNMNQWRRAIGMLPMSYGKF